MRFDLDAYRCCSIQPNHVQTCSQIGPAHSPRGRQQRTLTRAEKEAWMSGRAAPSAPGSRLSVSATGSGAAALLASGAATEKFPLSAACALARLSRFGSTRSGSDRVAGSASVCSARCAHLDAARCTHVSALHHVQAASHSYTLADREGRTAPMSLRDRVGEHMQRSAGSSAREQRDAARTLLVAAEDRRSFAT